MERRVSVMSKKLWEMARGFVLIIRKRKLLLDLNLRLQRHKISGNPIPIFNLFLFRRRRHTTGKDNPGLEEDETANDPPESDDMQMFMSPAPAAVDLNYSGKPMTAAAVRQVRITDSPLFAVVDGEEDDGDDVDKAAEEFIARFYRENAKKVRG